MGKIVDYTQVYWENAQWIHHEKQVFYPESFGCNYFVVNIQPGWEVEYTIHYRGLDQHYSTYFSIPHNSDPTPVPQRGVPNWDVHRQGVNVNRGLYASYDIAREARLQVPTRIKDPAGVNGVGLKTDQFNALQTFQTVDMLYDDWYSDTDTINWQTNDVAQTCAAILTRKHDGGLKKQTTFTQTGTYDDTVREGNMHFINEVRIKIVKEAVNAGVTGGALKFFHRVGFVSFGKL